MKLPIFSDSILQMLSDHRLSKSIVNPRYILKFYSSRKHNFDTLQNREIYMSSPLDFNDPYDCKLTFNREDLLKRYLTDWICNTCANLDRGIVREDNFDWNDMENISHTKDPSPICHRNDYTDTLDDALVSIYLNKNWEFSSLLRKRIDELLHFAQDIIKELNKSTNIGISCFCNCESPYNIDQTNLMWSHYAENHKGFCVLYCLDERNMNMTIDSNLFNTFVPVNYTKHRIFIPKMVILRLLNGRIIPDDIQTIITKIGLSLLTKSTVWKYENEWRLISDKVKERISFPYAAAIFIGCNAQKRHREKLKEIGNFINVPVFQTELDNTVYKLNNFNPKRVYYSLFRL